MRLSQSEAASLNIVWHKRECEKKNKKEREGVNRQARRGGEGKRWGNYRKSGRVRERQSGAVFIMIL